MTVYLVKFQTISLLSFIICTRDRYFKVELSDNFVISFTDICLLLMDLSLLVCLLLVFNGTVLKFSVFVVA